MAEAVGGAAGTEILVAGGTGLVGWHAARALLQRGHRVRLLARRPPRDGALLPGASFVQGDLLEGPLEAALAGCAGAVFAAGADYRVAPKGNAYDFFRRANVEAPLRLFRAAAAAGAESGVLVSSFYHAVRPELVEQPYIRTRAESEEEVPAAVAGRLRLAIVQPPYVIGRSQKRGSMGTVIARYVCSPAPLVAPPGGSNYIAGDAVGEAVATALARSPHGARHLLGDENLSWVALLERFVAAAVRAGRSTRAGRTARPTVLPAALFTSGASVARLVTSFTGRELGVDPTDWARLVTQDFFYDPTPARDALAYPTGALDAAIASCL